MERNYHKMICVVTLLAFLLGGVGTQSASAAEVAGASAVQQTAKVYGTVTDAIGPVIGAAIQAIGTNAGTITDENGKFELNVEPGTLLLVSCLGYKDINVVAAAGMQIVLTEDTTALEEVVVTALGIKRDRKALGYALSEIKGDELTKAKEPNVINSLAGKVAGLIINETAGGPSGSTRVLLRGNTEMTGNNQPLYVIDGVPLDNTNFGSAGLAGGYDLGDGISAINPDDIENMTVLKGPAASALYGSRASHGVILITTKKADKETFTVEYNGSFTLESQLAKWDNIQQVYGMGYNGDYTRDASSGTNMSWGPQADNFDVTYYDGQTRPFYMYGDNTSEFFRLGATMQNSVIMSTNTGRTGIRFSFTDMRNRDILPNTNMSRDNFNLRVNTSMGPVDFDFTANYTSENVKNRPALGDSQSNVGKNLMTLAGTYNQAWNTIGQTAKNEYFNHSVNGSLKWVFLKRLTLTASASYVQYIGFTDKYNEDYVLCNLYLGCKVFKNKRGEIQVGVNDILNQNTAFTRSTGSGYTQNAWNSCIGRYVSVQFVYNLRHFGKKGSTKMSDYNYKESTGSVGVNRGTSSGGWWGPRR